MRGHTYNDPVSGNGKMSTNSDLAADGELSGMESGIYSVDGEGAHSAPPPQPTHTPRQTPFAATDEQQRQNIPGMGSSKSGPHSRPPVGPLQGYNSDPTQGGISASAQKGLAAGDRLVAGVQLPEQHKYNGGIGETASPSLATMLADLVSDVPVVGPCAKAAAALLDAADRVVANHVRVERLVKRINAMAPVLRNIIEKMKE